MRRRKDLQTLENDLAEIGGRQLRWDGADIVSQIRSGDLSARGIPLYRFEGFQVLRAMMYLMTVTLIFLIVLSIAAAYGWGPLVGT